MRFEMWKSRTAAWIAAAVLGAAALGLGVWGVVSTLRQVRYQRYIESMVSRSYYELVGQLTTLEQDLGKAMVATTREGSVALLGEISRVADEAAVNLAALPAAHSALSETLGVVNRTGDYCRSLYEVREEGALTGQAFENLALLREACRGVRDTLSGEGEGAFLREAFALSDWYAEPAADTVGSRLSALDSQGEAYPTMIYDGPFSQSLQNRVPLGLGEGTVSAEAALGGLLEAFPAWKGASVSLTRVDAGVFPGYQFTMTSEDGGVLMALVSGQGGKIIWAIREQTTGGEARFSREACLHLAGERLGEMGFGAVEVTWSQQYDGMLVLNYAAVQEDVRLYPDLIKVRMDMETGELLAVDASAYWMNHRERELTQPSVTADEVLEKLHPSVEAESPRLVITPTDGGEERLCWEVRTTVGSDRFYQYFDGETGEETDIFLEINTDTGDLLV